MPTPTPAPPSLSRSREIQAQRRHSRSRCRGGGGHALGQRTIADRHRRGSNDRSRCRVLEAGAVARKPRSLPPRGLDDGHRSRRRRRQPAEARRWAAAGITGGSYPTHPRADRAAPRRRPRALPPPPLCPPPSARRPAWLRPVRCSAATTARTGACWCLPTWARAPRAPPWR